MTGRAPPAGLIRGAGKCPRCGCERVRQMEVPTEKCGNFYARTLEVCFNCKSAWEPIDRSLIWDWSDPACSFSQPCDNCAFRPGSPEQNNPAKWRELMDKLKGGGTFFCHKGIPIDPGGEDGFAYPRDRAGQIKTEKMRICRGYLNMLGRQWDKQRAAEEAKPNV